MARSPARHFVIVDAKGSTLWLRSSPSRVYLSASMGEWGAPVWHWDTRGVLAVHEVDAATSKRIRALILTRQHALRPGGSFGPIDSWVTWQDVPGDLQVALERGAR